MTSPRYDLTRGAAGLESHTIPRSILERKTPLRNINIPGGENTISNTEAFFNPVLHTKMRIGSGAYGAIYQVVVTPYFIEDLKRCLEVGGVKVFESFPSIGSIVIVKVVKQKGKTDDETFFKESARENIVHSKLASEKCRPTILACVSEFVPKFYLSFVLGNSPYPNKYSTKRQHQCISVMDSAGDTTVSDYDTPKGAKAYAEFYARAEKAVCSLWLAGYFHGDLHRQNLMVDEKGNVKLIDFGYATKMPDSFVTFISNGIKKMVSSGSTKSFGDLWTEGKMNGTQTVLEYSNRIMSGRRQVAGFDWYNPDSKVLRVLYNNIPKGGTKNLPLIRSKLWQIRTGSFKNDPIPKQKELPISPTLNTGNVKEHKTPAKTPAPPASSPMINTGKVDAKKRKVFKDAKGRTYVKQGDKKVFVKKLFTPRGDISPAKTPAPPASSPMINTGKVNAKQRKVFKDSKGRTYAKQGDKKVYVKKLFTPKRISTSAKTPAPPASSPMINTEKVNAKQRKVFKDSKGRTYAKQGDKKVYVKKLFTPKRISTSAILA